MGDGVNIAARLESIAKSGAICMSEQAYWQVKGRLDLAAYDLGPIALKNIAEPIRVYSLQVGIPAQAKPATEAKPSEPKKPSRLVLLGGGIAALLLVIAGLWYLFAANHPPPVASKSTEASHLSVVVLPFVNESGDPAQDYLADVLTDEVTTSLSRIRNSFVIARNTAFTYKGKPVDAKAIGKELGVRYVLEGSVQPSGNQVRVSAQLIDADSGTHLWAEQFDTTRVDLLQMQDEIVTHLAFSLELQFPEAEAARLKRTPAANRDAEDLTLQCLAAGQKAGYIGKEAEAGFRLCEQALAIDPNNVLALTYLSVKFFLPVALGLSTDPKTDLKRGDELVSRALALHPDFGNAHMNKGSILMIQGRPDEAIPEHERALALDPALVDAEALLGFDHLYLGQFEKSLEYFDKAIRLSPRDPYLSGWYEGKSSAYFGLKQYDQAIEWARAAIVTNPNYPAAHRDLIAAFALTGHEADAREALQRYLALPPIGPRTIAAWKALHAQFSNPRTDPRFLEFLDRLIEGLRKAGMPEE
jgi:adenylate cyclase